MNIRLFFRLLSVFCIATILFAYGCSKNSTGDDVVEDDGIAPTIVTDLTVSSFTDNSVTLSWTASGDDTTSGTASAYDLRIYSEFIHWDNFDSAQQLTGLPAPKASGEAEQFVVTGLTVDSTYYFALKVLDEVGNYQGVSNCVSATCYNDFVVNIPDADLLAAIRLQISKPSGDMLKSDLMAIRDLQAEDRTITDLTGMEYCVNLINFSLINNSVSNLMPLSSHEKLVQFNAGNNDISDISPLAGDTSLAVLLLKMNEIDDLDSLAGLTGLTVLDLQDNLVTDLTPLTDLTAMHYLILSQNYIRDIGPLVDNAGLSDVDTVLLSYNPLEHESIKTHIPALRARGVTVLWAENTTPPGDVADLTVTSATDNSVSLSWTASGEDYSQGIAYLYEVRYSTVQSELETWSGGETVSGVPAPDTSGTVQSVTVTGLEEGTLYYLAMRVQDNSENWSAVSNVVKARPYTDEVVTFPDAALETVVRNTIPKPSGDIYKSDLWNLDTLNGGNTGISDLTGLENCVNLTKLALGDNNITSVSRLAGLTDLTDLNIQGNQITDITPLGSLINMVNLQFSGNIVGDIGALSSMTRLRYLSMNFTGISSIGPLSSLTALEYLFYSGNSASDMSPLSSCPLLKYLSADYNAIESISVLSGLTDLTYLTLRNNLIEDITPLVDNDGLGEGDNIMLDNNPLSTQSIDVHIPALQARGATVSY